MKARPEREFYFRLAGHLGRSVAELLSTVSSRELSEWMAYERVAGPLGAHRIDVAGALVAAVVANVNRPSRSKSYDVEDFLPKWEYVAPEEMSPDQVWEAVRQAHAAFSMIRG